MSDEEVIHVSTRPVVSSPWLALQQDVVVDDLGADCDYWIVRRPSFVLVLPRNTSTGDVGLVRRHRYPVGQWFWEFPQRRVQGGHVDAAAVHDVADALLLDAIGGRHGVSLTPLGQFYEAYGWSDHRCYCLRADVDASSVPACTQLTWMSPEDFRGAVRARSIADAASLAAMALLDGDR